MPAKMPPELKLLAMCCAWPSSSRIDERIVALSLTVNDWARFEQLTHYHRVRPMVNDAIKRTGIAVPSLILASLQSKGLRSSARALMMGHETVRVAKLLSARGLDPLVVKGAALAGLCYPSLALKESWDIDFLVRDNEADLARRALYDAGYVVMTPALTGEQFARFTPLSKEIEFFNPENKITIELHWRLLNAGGKLNATLPPSTRQQVSLPFGAIQTLDDELLLSYLCLHGAMHNWSRIKWLADLNAFIGRFPPGTRSKLFDATREYGANRSAFVALTLCAQLFETDFRDIAPRRVSSDFVSELLVRNVTKSLGDKGPLEGRKARRSLWRRSVFASFVAIPGFAHIREAASYHWRSASDQALIPLPRKLGFMYHILRLPLWIGRLSQRRLARGSTKAQQK